MGKFQYPNAQIIIFARAPVFNQVKTRLIPDIGAEKATQLYQSMLEQTVDTAVKDLLCPVLLSCTPDSSHSFFQSLYSHYDIDLAIQQGSDLGERMFNASSLALDKFDHVILIGSDCLQMTPIHLKNVLNILSMKNHDTVITPATDGGYVLLGLNRVHRDLFENISWGTENVMQQTRASLNELGWQWKEMESLTDLDTVEDLRHIKQHEHQYQLNTGVRSVLETLFESVYE